MARNYLVKINWLFFFLISYVIELPLIRHCTRLQGITEQNVKNLVTINPDFASLGREMWGEIEKGKGNLSMLNSPNIYFCT